MNNPASVHRTWPLKDQPWIYYQEWNQALFFHWQVPFEILSQCIPSGLTLDHFNGSYYVSLVAFTMNKVRPRFLPAVSCISDFHEVNLRTYVKEGNKSGVYFLSIEGEKKISNFLAKSISGLPYEKASISRKNNEYNLSNPHNNNLLNCTYQVGEPVIKDELDIWLTERYCLYLQVNHQNYIYEIEHKEWDLNKVQLENLKLNYKISTLSLDTTPTRCHYSVGVKVKAWVRDRV